MTILSINTPKALSNWKIIVDVQAAGGKDTSIFDIILSLIVSKIRRHMWNSVPLFTQSGIISLRHCGDLNFVVFVTSLLVFMNMTLPPIICLE